MDMEWKAVGGGGGEVKWGMMALLILSLPVLHSNYRSVTVLGMQSIDCMDWGIKRDAVHMVW